MRIIKDLKKEFFQGGHVNPNCKSAAFCEPHNETQKVVTYNLDSIWNWIINNFEVKKSNLPKKYKCHHFFDVIREIIEKEIEYGDHVRVVTICRRCGEVRFSKVRIKK